MKERPILFSGPMVGAILEGRKTQTRRAIKTEGLDCAGPCGNENDGGVVFAARDWSGNSVLMECPYGAPGDRLWVRETHARVHPGMLQSLDPDPDSHEWTTVYMADSNGGYVGKLMECTKWKPSIFMRREFSRITLEIEAVRVERLQDISEEDAKAEGCVESIAGSGEWVPMREVYAELWNSINRPRLPSNQRSRRYARVKRYLDKHPDLSWDANPWVWVIQFRRVKP